MRQDNIAILEDTLGIIEKGSYETGGRTVKLKLTPAEMKDAVVYLPKDLREMEGSYDKGLSHPPVRTGFSCMNMDSFALARLRTEQFRERLSLPGAKPVLVLNLTNPVNPGGGVRRGARAQEEDLCRKSTLLVSLEGGSAAPYYIYNRSLNTYMGSDAVMIHPQVEIIKDENGELLPETVIVSVMTCAAPMITYGLEGMSQDEYESMVYGRITGMLKTAAFCGYEYLILGAFGCGAFHNDAAVVSDLFRDAVTDLDMCGKGTDELFRRIEFAVLDRSGNQYNYNEFARNFRDYYGEDAEEN